MLVNLKTFARERAASHPGLFDPQNFPSDLFREMGDAGLLGAVDLGTIARGNALIASETGSLGFATAWTEQSMIPLVLEKRAGLPSEVKAGVKSGETILALAVSEPKAGAHPKYLSTTATRVQGGWNLDGEKAYVTSGPIASHVAVLAITDTSGGRKSFSFFLVPTDAKGLSQINHPQFDFLRPAQHCGFRLEGCTVPESALIGRPGKGYEDIAGPFRNLEDAVLTGGIIGVLARAGRRTARALGPNISEEQALFLGEMAGIEAALEALDTPVVKALEAWDTDTDAVEIRLVAIRDLARRCTEILHTIGTGGDEHVDRILWDVEKSLDIARTARQIRKARLGRSYFISIKDFSGKEPE